MVQISFLFIVYTFKLQEFAAFCGNFYNFYADVIQEYFNFDWKNHSHSMLISVFQCSASPDENETVETK